MMGENRTSRRARTFVHDYAFRVSHRATRLWSTIRGPSSSLLFVSEYPKSGGTWLARMLAFYFDLPLPQRSPVPRFSMAVIHNHWLPSRRRGKTVYVLRDGRDVMTSLYFHRMRVMEVFRDRPSTRRYAKRYARVFGPSFDPQAVRTNLPSFIDEEMTSPWDCALNWPEHARAWLRRQPTGGLVVTSYEKLLLQSTTELARVVQALSGEAADPVRIANTVQQYSFERMAGRSRGEEDRSSFLRKGVIGDWRNYFSAEAAAVFDEHAGALLIELGYECDRSWVASTGA